MEELLWNFSNLNGNGRKRRKMTIKRSRKMVRESFSNSNGDERRRRIIAGGASNAVLMEEERGRIVEIKQLGFLI